MEQDRILLEKTTEKQNMNTIDTNTLNSEGNFTSPRENFKTIGSNIISSNYKYKNKIINILKYFYYFLVHSKKLRHQIVGLSQIKD
jgi:hypothetical protein